MDILARFLRLVAAPVVLDCSPLCPCSVELIDLDDDEQETDR